MSMDYTKNTQCLQIVSMLILIQSVKPPRVDKGLQPLMFNPALTTRASERMKTQRFSYFAGFAARERMREAKPEKDSLKWLKATLAKCLLSDIFAAHVLYQHIGYLHGAVGLLVILQYGGYGAAYRNA